MDAEDPPPVIDIAPTSIFIQTYSATDAVIVMPFHISHETTLRCIAFRVMGSWGVGEREREGDGRMEKGGTLSTLTKTSKPLNSILCIGGVPSHKSIAYRLALATAESHRSQTTTHQTLPGTL